MENTDYTGRRKCQETALSLALLKKQMEGQGLDAL